jgi:hypothetical protein
MRVTPTFIPLSRDPKLGPLIITTQHGYDEEIEDRGTIRHPRRMEVTLPDGRIYVNDGYGPLPPKSDGKFVAVRLRSPDLVETEFWVKPAVRHAGTGHFMAITTKPWEHFVYQATHDPDWMKKPFGALAFPDDPVLIWHEVLD